MNKIIGGIVSMDKQNITLIMVNEGMAKLINTINLMIDQLKNNQIEEMYRSLSQMTDETDWLIEAVARVQELLEEKIEIMEINHIISEIIMSIHNKDYILLTDLLQYELLELVTSWQQIIQ